MENLYVGESELIPNNPFGMVEEEFNHSLEDINSVNFYNAQSPLEVFTKDLKEGKETLCCSLQEIKNGSEMLNPKSLKKDEIGKENKPRKALLKKVIGEALSSSSELESISENSSKNLDNFEIGPFLTECFYSNYFAKKAQKAQGRPRKEKDMSEEAILTLISKELNQRMRDRKKKNKDQRIDAKTTSFARDMKNVPNIILKYCIAKNRFKSTNIIKVIEAYAEVFTIRFLPIFYGDEEVEDLFLLFCEFIVLKFPASKVKVILNMMSKGNLVSKSEIDYLSSQLKTRKLPAKKDIKKLARENRCFAKFIAKLPSQLEFSSEDEEVKCKRIFNDIIEDSYNMDSE